MHLPSGVVGIPILIGQGRRILVPEPADNLLDVVVGDDLFLRVDSVGDGADQGQRFVGPAGVDLRVSTS